MAQTLEQKYSKEIAKGNKVYKELTLEQFKDINIKFDATCDGTNVGTYCDWLFSKKNAQEIVHAKDENIYNGISDFAEFKDRLTAMGLSANIFDYSVKDIKALHIKCNDFRNSHISVATNNALDKYKGEFVIEYQSEKWWVVRSLTYNAERNFFGQNTSWCTTGSERWFNRYSDEGYLICVPVENGTPDFKSPKRLQFHISDSISFYCCDSRDRRVSQDEFPKELTDFLHDVIAKKKERVKGKIGGLQEKITEIIHNFGVVEVPTKSKNFVKFNIMGNTNLVVMLYDLSLKIDNGKNCKTLVSGVACDRDTYIDVNKIENIDLSKYTRNLTPILRMFNPAVWGGYTITDIQINGVNSFVILTLEKGDKKCYVRYGICSYYSKPTYQVSLAKREGSYYGSNDKYVDYVLGENNEIIESFDDFMERNESLLTLMGEVYDTATQIDTIRAEECSKFIRNEEMPISDYAYASSCFNFARNKENGNYTTYLSVSEKSEAEFILFTNRLTVTVKKVASCGINLELDIEKRFDINEYRNATELDNEIAKELLRNQFVCMQSFVKKLQSEYGCGEKLPTSVTPFELCEKLQEYCKKFRIGEFTVSTHTANY